MCFRFVAAVALGFIIHGTTYAQSREEATVLSATTVLDQTMAIPLGKIPPNLRDRAEGVAIFPNVIKGGFIIGARHGSGVLLVRDAASRAWHAPVFATVTGANLGFQAGLQSTDLVLIFTTRQSVQQTLNGQFTIGADAAAAAGPVGRETSAATDIRLSSEIFSYSRSRGLFAGVSLDGSVIQIDAFANGAYYHTGPEGQTIIPPAAIALTQKVTYYTSGAQPSSTATAAVSNPTAPSPNPTAPSTALNPIPGLNVPVNPVPSMAITSVSEADQLRDQLRRISPELYENLSPEWSTYLTLPAAVFTGQGRPTMDELNQTVARFDAVAANPAYRKLTQTPQFQSTYGLLRHYQSSLRADAQPGLHQLPAPPQVSFRVSP